MGILLTQVSINNAVNLTFQQLGTQLTENKISAGKIYRVNNWKSSYMEWNGSTYNIVQVSDYQNYTNDFLISDPHTGQPYNAEPLYFLGLSGNRLSSIAWSELFPYDEITFEFDFTGPGGSVNLSKSRITRRKDNILGIDCFYDWRWIRFPRFKYTITHNVTYNSIINDFSTQPIYSDITNYHGLSPYLIDYPNITLSLVDRLVETQNIIDPLFSHNLTFINYLATGFENIYISYRGNSNSVFKDIGNNIVFYNTSKNIQLTNCEDLTFSECNDINLYNSSFSTFISSNKIDAEINQSVIQHMDNSSGMMNKFFVSNGRFVIQNNKFDITDSILTDWTTQLQDNIISDNNLVLNEVYIGGTINILQNTSFSIIGNLGKIENSYLYHSSDSFDYSSIVSEGVIDDLTYVTYDNYKSFNYNEFDLIKNSNIESYFFLNKFNTLESIKTIFPFFENSITGNIIGVNFDKIIFKKIKTHEYSTFDKVIPIDRITNLDPLIPDGPDNANFWSNQDGYSLTITAEEFQYVGIFYLDYPYNYWTNNGNQEIFYVDYISLDNLPQHRIMFKGKENSDFNWFLVFRNTPTALVSTERNIMLANTTILPLSETNRDWVVFQADGINIGSVVTPNILYTWQQKDAQTYNTFGENSWPFGITSMTPQDNCCPAEDITYNSTTYTNVQDALDAALYQKLVISNFTISNVGVVLGNVGNTSFNREIGEQVDEFTLSFVSNKKMSMITEIQIAIQRTPISAWENLTLINSLGSGSGYYQYVPFTTAPFNNPNATSLSVVISSAQLTSTPIVKTTKIRLRIKTSSIDPLTLLTEEIDFIGSMNFYYPMYYGSSGLPIDINTLSSLNTIKKLEFLNQPIATQPDFATKFVLQNVVDKYIFVALHTDLLNNFITNVVNPFSIVSTQVYNPEIRTYGSSDVKWITYLITRPNPWNSVNENYIIFRSQYKNTSPIIPIEITNIL